LFDIAVGEDVTEVGRLVVCNDHEVNATMCPVMTDNFIKRAFVVWGGYVGAPSRLDVPRLKVHRVIINIKELKGFEFIIWGDGWRRWR
jgi:hypothetical protein